MWIVDSASLLGSIGNDIQTGENFDGSLDLIKVVNTSEYLWLYRQTYSNAFEVSSGKNNFLVETTCIRRIKTGLSKEEYNFTEIDIMELTNIGGNYTGRFIYENNTKTYFTKSPTSMTVFQEGAKDPDYVTVLEYTDPDTYYCSVFTVYFLENKITDDFDKCEMYIRNSHLLMGPTQGCFQNTTRQTRRLTGLHSGSECSGLVNPVNAGSPPGRDWDGWNQVQNEADRTLRGPPQDAKMTTTTNR
ncbi:hypothetical protein MRX96_029754 [Rhipicephalus microplus]